jgi:transposase, IS5 family
MHRTVGQASFLDSMLDAEGFGHNPDLEALGAAIDWRPLEHLVSRLYARGEGRPSYPPLIMVKALLVQQWYNVSDPRLEFLLKDSLSMRRFVGLGLQDGTPDHSTISRFRSQLAKHELDGKLFDEIGRQLDARGFVLRKGTIIDATIVEAAVRKPPLKDGEGARSKTDPDARWTRKNGRSHFGYKAHVGMDQDSGVIRTRSFTGANAGDSGQAEALIAGDEKAVYADRGYENKQRRRALRARGVKDRIMHRADKHRPELPSRMKLRNRLISKVRAQVERVFAVFKHGWGYRRVRYIGLRRNEAHFNLLCLAFNIQRMAKLARMKPA